MVCSVLMPRAKRQKATMKSKINRRQPFIASSISLITTAMVFAIRGEITERTQCGLWFIK